jgi:hypothetical protein
VKWLLSSNVKSSALLRRSVSALNRQEPPMEKPSLIIRISDGERFVLNENGTYSNESMISFRDKGHIIGEWSYDCLMVINKGFFNEELQ